MTRRNRPSGFTLVEVVVGLTVAAAVVLAAHRIVTAVLDHADYVATLRARADRAANGERWLHLLTARTVTEPGRPFIGRSGHSTFSSRCETASGWLALCEVEIRFDSQRARFVVTGSTGIAFTLREGVTRGAVRYYLVGDRTGSVLVDTESQLSPPDALLVIADRDTLVFPIGDRG